VADGEKVGLYIFEGQSKSLVIDNLCLIHDGNGRLYSESENQYPAFQSGMYVVAIAPYNNEWAHSDNAVRAFSVNIDQRSYNNFTSSDLRHALPVDNNPISSSSVELAFAHLYSRIDIEVLDANESFGLATGTVRVLNAITGAMVEPYTVFVVDRPDTGKFTILPYETVHTSRRLLASVILPPQSFEAGDDLLQLSCSGKTMTCGLPQATTISTGETLSLQINLSSSGMEVVSSSISDWENGDSFSFTID
jgi:hypothetical protein